MAQIIREEELQGKYVNLREITVADVAFVISLRCSPKARFLNPTKNDVKLQEQYIENSRKKIMSGILLWKISRTRRLGRLEFTMHIMVSLVPLVGLCPIMQHQNRLWKENIF
ncbi:hypothetical protein NHP164001_13600 [Helicobacter trogontum]|uniref:N-acetyltransferase n=1 Tax=Helicobacter trogontum TaxID=50960 RepID=A0ABQ0D4R3_9HELI